MSWIKTVAYADAKGKLLKLYDRIKGPDNNVDNIMLAHSLRPHTMEGHMAVYKYVLHHSNNTIEKWFLEAIGVYTSMCNVCEYCVEHHYAGMSRLVADESRAKSIRKAMEQDDLGSVFDAKQRAAFMYARKLTISPQNLKQKDIKNLGELGWEEGEILEINQVVAYFNYANRTVLGLGVKTDGDIIGLSPNDSDDPDNWQHK